MGLTKWITSKLVFSLLIMSGFYIIGKMFGIIPKPLDDIVGWFGNNFLLISVLLMFMFTWLIIRALTSKRRIEHV